MAAILNSNSGESDLVIDLEFAEDYAHDGGFVASVTIRGSYWDGDHTHPVTSSVDGLWLRTLDIEALRNHIITWVGQPLDRLIPDQLNGSFELARLPGQSLLIVFGPRTDTISSLKPVVGISLSAGDFRCNLHFVTGQSCLSIFAHELEKEIKFAASSS